MRSVKVLATSAAKATRDCTLRISRSDGKMMTDWNVKNLQGAGAKSLQRVQHNIILPMSKA